MDRQVISLFDHSGISVTPWAEAGFDCYCYDLQNKVFQTPVGEGQITFAPWDARDIMQNIDILKRHQGQVSFLSCYPPCTDLTVAGANYFKQKESIDSEFQRRAMELVTLGEAFGERWGAPYYIENPVGVISTLWRKPDYKFHPYEYGGYLAESEADHPIYSQITPRDEYPKKTCLWTGQGFVMPPPIYAVPPKLDSKWDSFHMKLSGWMDKQERTNIRSATPRGFATAVFIHNVQL